MPWARGGYDYNIMLPAARHLYLSPHLDDAVLSCGGMIHRQSRRGERVVVMTVCAGVPPRQAISPYAALLHRRWGRPPAAGADTAAVVAMRRAEDAVALARVGAEGVYLDVPDVIYRRTGSGDWVVHDDASLVGGSHPGEADLVDALAERFDLLAPEARDANAAPPVLPTVYAPLAVGNHVDHWLTRRAAEAWAGRRRWVAGRLVYYEDYPYAEQAAAIGAAIGPSAEHPRGETGHRWRSAAVSLDDSDMAAKTAAIAAYASQISSFWADEAAMADAVRAFGAARAGAGESAERVWLRRPGSRPTAAD